MAPTFIANKIAFLAHSLVTISAFTSASSINHEYLHHGRHHILAKRAPPTGWESKGCFTDDGNPRTLSGPFMAANDLTTASCVSFCSLNGYSFAGTEYAGECWCGRSIATSASQSSSDQCNLPCRGAPDEKCGGNSRISIYHNISDVTSTEPPATNTGLTNWDPIGCFSDQGPVRTLRYGAEVPGGYMNMTIPGCTAACQSGGYSFAGVEYSQECYCDNEIQNGGVPGFDGCTYACRGDPLTQCGGSNRIDVFSFKKASSNATSSISTTTTSSTTATSTSASTTTTPPAPTAYTGNWTYQGCYIDGQNGRILDNFAPSPDDTSIDSCITTCARLGYSIAGLEYFTQCFCGKKLINGAALADSDDQCNTPCRGNSNQKCGGGDRMSIYSSTKNITVATVPKARNDSLPGNWTYSGCLAENPGSRAFESHFMELPDHNNVTGCIELCGKFGYSAAGLEYGTQCMCGDDWDRINAGILYVPEARCDFACPGNETDVCGGLGTISYYTTSDMPSWSQGVGIEAGSYDFLIGGVVIPLITQVGVHGKVIMVEKAGTGPPNSTGAYELDMSQINNGMDAAWREMYGLRTDVFCAAGVTLPDKGGRVLNVGGWSGDSTYGVRLYWPDGSDGVEGERDWEENFEELSLLEGRWYPTAMIMANGSVLVVGGQEGSNGPPVPSAEILPKPEGGYSKQYDWLRRTDPYNLYPFMTVLPNGGIAIFYYNEARILDEVTLDTVRSLPNIPGAVENPKAGRTYPLEGTFMLLPQHAPYTDPLRVIICGGSASFTGFALDNCANIAPEDPQAEWEIERMPDKRVITCMTALPDGTYLILNGAHQGEAGFGLGQDPAHMAMLYEPEKPQYHRFTRMANTTIDRMYHSEAILLLDGRVLVSGSDPEDGIHPQEYRLETFTPPYLLGNLAASRPAYTMPNSDWAFGGSYTIQVTSGQVAKISLMAAVASTHGNSMGQRTIFPAYSCSGGTCTITAPPNAHVAGGPGWHMLFVMNGNGTPSMGQWVRIGGDPAGVGNWPDLPEFTLPGV